ncbi:MAG: 23S rRNA (adenine(2503)-C(2))-methyltransferase RlmN [Deltaproteobacteria bacterium]|jgi:23S rRNA (adenine2503-C2)-methyltransferase
MQAPGWSVESNVKVDLKSLDLKETEAWVEELGMKPYRARQIRHWLFKGLASSFDNMTSLSKELRARLKDKAFISPSEGVKTEISDDGTRKYLFRLGDGNFIESVLIPERGHCTLCISSQAGCAMGCRFCLTARQGLKRNLTPSEIIDQVIQVKRDMTNPEGLTNLVFMGMGEPLANYDAVIKALRNLISEEGVNFSHRKVTVSTCGLIPQMRRLAEDVSVNLAVSLNAADEETRTSLMPVNRRYSLESLISACKDFPLPNRRMITFEYILINGINDRDRDARKLAALLTGLRAKINLIALNAHPGLDMSPPSMDRVLRFQDILIRANYTAIIRKSKGRDISAACGQLSGSFS